MLQYQWTSCKKYTAVYALTEPEKKSKGLACFIVDRENTAGVRTGKIENKMGIRSAQVSSYFLRTAVYLHLTKSLRTAMDSRQQ